MEYVTFYEPKAKTPPYPPPKKKTKLGETCQYSSLRPHMRFETARLTQPWNGHEALKVCVFLSYFLCGNFPRKLFKVRQKGPWAKTMRRASAFQGRKNFQTWKKSSLGHGTFANIDLGTFGFFNRPLTPFWWIRRCVKTTGVCVKGLWKPLAVSLHKAGYYSLHESGKGYVLRGGRLRSH